MFSPCVVLADINECESEMDDCDDKAMCKNTIGSYNCTCNPGYRGSGFMTDCSKFTYD